ncbi:MAG: cysteine synthase family protein [Chloroflexi bacterium]|nr:cysteine synthase family protein [Chloroflexota bacterium]
MALASPTVGLQRSGRKVGQKLESLIGNTPLLGFSRITADLPEDVQIFAKAEWHNPGGSVKDRAALNIILNAERDGLLTPGKTIMDSTSGNTGIAYAMIGASRGYGVKLFIPANVSPERMKILQAYGVDLVLTDPMEGSDGAITAVRELAAAEPDHYFYANQYNNPANWQAHYQTTAPEIWEQTDGQITHFLAGLGTTGTFTGTVRRLKELNPQIQAISVQPDSPFNGLEGLKHIPTAIRPGIYDDTLADANLGISTEATYEMARRLAREEGYLVGISSAAAMLGALQVAEEMADRGESAVIVTVFPDNAYKYLSESFWTEG